MRLTLMLCLIGFSTNAFAQKDGVRLVTVEYKPESDTYEFIELLGTTEYSAPSTSLSFSSGNGILVKDMERLNKLLTTKQNAMFLPDRTSVPEVLKGMLAPATIVIFNRDPKALDPNINPIFAARSGSPSHRVIKDKLAREGSRIGGYRPDPALKPSAFSIPPSAVRIPHTGVYVDPKAVGNIPETIVERPQKSTRSTDDSHEAAIKADAEKRFLDFDGFLKRAKEGS